MSDETDGSDSDDRSSAKPPAPSRGRKPAGRRRKDAEATAAGSESPRSNKTTSAEPKRPAPRKRPARKADAALSPTARRTVSRARIARAVLDRYRRR